MENKTIGRTHLIIGDPHASPHTNNDRFDWLGCFIIERKPDVIICMGDMGDMPSLCSYDKGTRGFEGRRYRHDVAAVHDALERIRKPIDDYNRMRARNHKSQYRPRWVMLGGNHDEARINRAIETDAALLEGVISLDDLKYAHYGWEYHPFKEVVNIDRIAYSHYFISGVMGQPIGGIHSASNLIAKGFVSCTAGHSHLMDYSVRTNSFGERLHGLHAGVFDDNLHDYAGKANDLWWRGLIMKHGVRDGDYELEQISMDRLREMYN